MQVGVQEFIELQSGGYKATVLEVPIRYAIFYQILNILGFLGSVAVTILGLIGIFPYVSFLFSLTFTFTFTFHFHFHCFIFQSWSFTIFEKKKKKKKLSFRPLKKFV